MALHVALFSLAHLAMTVAASPAKGGGGGHSSSSPHEGGGTSKPGDAGVPDPFDDDDTSSGGNPLDLFPDEIGEMVFYCLYLVIFTLAVVFVLAKRKQFHPRRKPLVTFLIAAALCFITSSSLGIADIVGTYYDAGTPVIIAAASVWTWSLGQISVICIMLLVVLDWRAVQLVEKDGSPNKWLRIALKFVAPALIVGMTLFSTLEFILAAVPPYYVIITSFSGEEELDPPTPPTWAGSAAMAHLYAALYILSIIEIVGVVAVIHKYRTPLDHDSEDLPVSHFDQKVMPWVVKIVCPFLCLHALYTFIMEIARNVSFEVGAYASIADVFVGGIGYVIILSTLIVVGRRVEHKLS